MRLLVKPVLRAEAVTTGAKENSMEFTPEQQAIIDSLINKRVAEVRTAAEAKAREEIATAIAAADAKVKEVAVAKDKELADLKAKVESGGKGNEDLTALKAEVERLKAKDIKNTELARKSQLLAAASELNAISAEQVAMLVSPHVKSDETLTILNAEGKVRVNSEGNNMTVKEFMTEFLAGNTHLVKAGGASGAGSQGNRGGDNAGVKTIK